MSDPQSPTIGLYQVPRGGDVGTWDLPTNANWGAVDSLFGNVAVVGLTNLPVTLSVPPNSGAAWAGPYQAQSSLVRFTGTLTANVTVTLPRPGFYIIENLVTLNSFIPILSTGVGSSNVIGCPPNKKFHVFNDGTNMDFVNMPEAGFSYDLTGTTTIPLWIQNCTVKPYLLKDGTVYNNSQYPALAAFLGTTFGGTPNLTFAVPDERGRMRIGFDPNNTGRVNSTVNAGTMGSAGGAQALNSTNQIPQISYTPAGLISGSQSLGSVYIPGSGASLQAGSGPAGSTSLSVNFADASFAGTAVNFGSATPSQALPPTIVSILPLIKT